LNILSSLHGLDAATKILVEKRAMVKKVVGNISLEAIPFHRRAKALSFTSFGYTKEISFTSPVRNPGRADCAVVATK
jgi:hypothetical protein